jgi:hypothetical protein
MRFNKLKNRFENQCVGSLFGRITGFHPEFMRQLFEKLKACSYWSPFIMRGAFLVEGAHYPLCDPIGTNNPATRERSQRIDSLVTKSRLIVTQLHDNCSECGL